MKPDGPGALLALPLQESDEGTDVRFQRGVLSREPQDVIRHGGLDQGGNEKAGNAVRIHGLANPTVLLPTADEQRNPSGSATDLPAVGLDGVPISEQRAEERQPKQRRVADKDRQEGRGGGAESGARSHFR